ncbi:MAG: energy-coupling factor transporter transmembrane protein EcfT [Candidatus Cloacimonetes bacterium]|nr:energy-coupling factor transporter transmembrane protein EcfT [Candidatus Cloacimonadota bacterium]
MKINLRTLLIIVILITSLSVIYQKIFVQIVLILLSILLLFLIHPNKKKSARLLHRLKNLGKIIFTLMLFQILFRRGGDVLWQWGIIKITSVGINYGVTSSLRFFLIILIAGLLFDIPHYDYLLALRSWKIPYEISFLVASVINFIPTFNNQFRIIIEELSLRGIDLKRIPILKRPRAYISLIFPVVARTIANARFRAISLELRGFRLYRHRTYLYENKLKWLDYVIQSGVLFGFLMIIYFYHV